MKMNWMMKKFLNYRWVVKIKSFLNYAQIVAKEECKNSKSSDESLESAPYATIDTKSKHLETIYFHNKLYFNDKEYLFYVNRYGEYKETIESLTRRIAREQLVLGSSSLFKSL